MSVLIELAESVASSQRIAAGSREDFPNLVRRLDDVLAIAHQFD
jgi:hypothetical protein